MTGVNDHNLNYEDILKAQKDDSILIIDVREDGEIRETGKLPGSIHIPSEYTFCMRTLTFVKKKKGLAILLH